jgi:hypothetical protein
MSIPAPERASKQRLRGLAFIGMKRKGRKVGTMTTNKGGKGKPGVNFFDPRVVDDEHAAMEKVASEVANDFRACCRKLKELAPKVKIIQDYFATSVRGSVTLAGCGSFKEFCQKKLGRTKQAVYAMLGEYPQRQKERKRKQPKKVPVPPLELSEAAVIRMRDGLNAVYRARSAEKKGRKQDAEAAWNEYDCIAEAEPIRSKIQGDHPNLEMIVAELLTVIESQSALFARTLTIIEKLPNEFIPIALPADLKKAMTTSSKVVHAYRTRLGMNANVSGGVN